MFSVVANLFRRNTPHQTDDTLRNVPLSHSVDYTGVKFEHNGVQFTICKYAIIGRNGSKVETVLYSELTLNQRAEWIFLIEQKLAELRLQHHNRDKLERETKKFKRIQRQYETKRMQLDPYYTF